MCLGLALFATDKATATPVSMPALVVPAVLPPIPPVAGYTVPVREWAARRVSIDATAGDIRTELGIDVGKCSVTIIAPASQVNIGGRDVDNSTKYVSLCTSGCDITTSLSIDTSAGALFIRSASGSVTTAFLVGSGC